MKLVQPMKEDKKEIERIISLMTEHEEPDLSDADLKTMLIVIGSYLYAGAEIEEVDDGTYDRLVSLLVKHINREVLPPDDITLN